MTGGQEMRKSRKIWENHIQQCERSGQKQLEYCRQFNLNPKTYSVWKHKIQNERGPERTLFVPLKREAAAEFVIKTSSGFELKFPQIPEPKWMAQFLKNLEAHNAAI